MKFTFVSFSELRLLIVPAQPPLPPMPDIGILWFPTFPFHCGLHLPMMGLVGLVLFLMLLIYSLTISHTNPMYLDPVKLMHTLGTL